MRRSSTAVLGALALTVAAVIAGPTTASAEPGDLDGVYGVCGISVISRGGGSQLRPVAVVRQLGGRRIVVSQGAGYSRVTALRSDGTIDLSFGQGGSVYPPISFNLNGPTKEWAWSVGRDRIVLFGSGATSNMLLALDRNGAIDASFGTGGSVRTGRLIAAATKLSDDSIVVADGNTDGPYRFRRFGADGALDTTFVSTLPAFPYPLIPAILASDQSSRFYVLAAYPFAFGAGQGREVWRLGADGTVDPSFHVQLPVVGPEDIFDGRRVMVIRATADGVIVEMDGPNPSDPAAPRGTYLTRYTTTGALDPTFGVGGTATVTSRPAGIRDFSVTPNGGIFAVGLLRDTFVGQLLFFTAHLSAAGSLVPGSFRTEDIADDNSSDVSVLGASSDGRGSVFGFTSDWPSYVSGVARSASSPLRVGAGLMLQWNGDAWPTRFGNDPGPQCPFDTPYWPDAENARGITTVAGKGGYEVDLFGGIHPFSIGFQHPAPTAALGNPYWLGWDIARGIAAKRNGTGGYVLDGFGGIHPFHAGSSPQPPTTTGSPYWPGWDIARSIALLPDGNRGYVLDGFGGIHRFTTPGHRLPPALNHTAYWPGWDIARGISVLDDGTGGYIVDGYGGVHPFGIGTHVPPPPPGRGSPYVPGVDWARGFAFVDPIAAPVGAVASASASTSSGTSTTDWSDARRAISRRRGPRPSGLASR